VELRTTGKGKKEGKGKGKGREKEKEGNIKTLSGKPDPADQKPEKPSLKIPYEKIIAHLNNKTQKHFKHDNKTTQAHIRARWQQGFVLDDFISVIDKKTAKWGHDPKMADYLRPETLFGSKFEAYLNETCEQPRAVSDCTIRNLATINAWMKGSDENER
jgi:uncharacterized phage protein (TIGR02220 family)